MKLPFFFSFILFTAWLAFTISRSRRKVANQKNNFWERELAANSTRRQPLDDLNYITIPFDTLPIHVMEKDETIADCLRTLQSLADSPIVNFTGISNTDLKLQYGAPNIDILSRYDQSYTTMVCTLQKWAERLHEEGEEQAARQVLEFAVSTDTDISGTYRLLASIYTASGEQTKIQELIEKAQGLRSGSKKIIVRTLQEFGQ